ncbi:MAG TPA: flagellar basal body rod protein FlgC [Halanaerobiales bacterium]|nr:flagellar basal body rod protein FlgC [Halanaerobiales bacterium]
MFSTVNISASGLTAQRLRMDLIADNIANVNTTRTEEEGIPYRRKLAIFRERSSSFSNSLASAMSGSQNNNSGEGVEVAGIREDNSPFKTVYRPNHPDANQEGYVQMPNINITSEMVDMITASRAYEANVTALNTTKRMAMKALEIGRG